MDKMRKLAMVSDFDQVKAGSPGVEAEIAVARMQAANAVFMTI